MDEIWKQIEEYDNYSVSTYGNVKNDNTGRILKLGLTNKGYYKVGFRKNGKKKYFSVHRLVATSFIDNPLNLPQVDHIDNNKLNNRVENLRWCTHQQNILNKTNKSIHGSYIQFMKNMKKKPWRVQIKYKSIDKFFKTKQEALDFRNDIIKDDNEDWID